MTTWIILTVLAAFGGLCVLWALFGFLVPGQRGAALVCICRGDPREEQILRHYGWLRDLGLIRAPMVLVDGGLTEDDRLRLLRCRQDVELLTMEELSSRLEQERNKLG